MTDQSSVDPGAIDLEIIKFHHSRPTGIMSFEIDNLIAAVEVLREENRRLRSGRGPDDTTGCPAGHGDQCCGWHQKCREALASNEGADK